MTLEERIKEQENMILQSIKEKKPRCAVYNMMNVYEDLYAELKNPEPVQQNDFIKLYFKYCGYMERNGRT